MTTFEVAGRNKKAAALLAVLREAGISASVAREGSADDWALAAKQAGVKKPSADTIALVIEYLEGEREPECLCVRTDVDECDSRGCPQHDRTPELSTRLVLSGEMECPI